MNLKSTYAKLFSILLLVFSLILLSFNHFANDKSILERRVQKLDDTSVKAMSSYFLTNFATDPLVKDYLKFINTVVLDVSLTEKVEEGCLELKLTNVYQRHGEYFYELSCDCCGWYCQNFPSKDKSGCIVVYVDRKGRLVRINDNVLNLNSSWEMDNKDRAIKALEHFLRDRQIKPKTVKKETIADIFISLVCLQNVGDFPQQIELLSEKTQGNKTACDFIADYGYRRCQYTIIFDSSNHILNAKCNCYAEN